MLAVGWWGVVHVHGLLARPEWRIFEYDLALIARFAIPAVLANVATPAGGAYVTVAMSQFSDSAVAGWAVIGRIIPIAFGAIFALSGAIGPIIGQNIGARQFERVRSALYGGLAFAASITALAWLVLSLAAPVLVRLFNASGEAAELIVFFCRWLAPLFVFFGTLFVCNAACNTLGRPHYATALNWGRATLGHHTVRHARRALGRQRRAGRPHGRRHRLRRCRGPRRLPPDRTPRTRHRAHGPAAAGGRRARLTAPTPAAGPAPWRHAPRSAPYPPAWPGSR